MAHGKTADSPAKGMFDGLDLAEFSRDKSTPFLVVSERRVRGAYERLSSALGVDTARMFYSVKTNYETPVLKALHDAGCGVEVYRRHELEIALKAGFDGSRIVMDGPCKDEADLVTAMDQGVMLVNAESLRELELLDRIAGKAGRVQDVGIRLALGIDCFPNIFNFVGLRRAKPFGFQEREVPRVLELLGTLDNCRLRCVSAHMTTPVARHEFFARRLRFLFRIAVEARKKGFPVDMLDIGGGYPSEESVRFSLPRFLGRLPFGNTFVRGRVSGNFEPLGLALRDAWSQSCGEFGFEPGLLLEPGRCIVDDAMIAVGRVADVRGNDVITDISATSQVPYQSEFQRRPIFVPGRQGESKGRSYRFCGPTMMPYDVIGQAEADGVSTGDLVVVCNVGAYCTCQSKPWMMPRCACYAIGPDGHCRMSRRAETAADMIDTQL